ncbi:MAG: hypothetical protein AAGJ81_04575 [Verrucomicrobiota bacterium]
MPAEGVPLVYYYSKRPYWIVGEIAESEPFVTNENGFAYVPSRRSMYIAEGSIWQSGFLQERTLHPEKDTKIYYASPKKVEQDE